jgi:hypothetical protein
VPGRECLHCSVPTHGVVYMYGDVLEEGHVRRGVHQALDFGLCARAWGSGAEDLVAALSLCACEAPATGWAQNLRVYVCICICMCICMYGNEAGLEPACACMLACM